MPRKQKLQCRFSSQSTKKKIPNYQRQSLVMAVFLPEINGVSKLVLEPKNVILKNCLNLFSAMKTGMEIKWQ